MTKRLRRARGLLIAGVLAAAMTVGVGIPGASPAAAAGHCGSVGTEWVPDRGPSFDFGESCRLHDLCYGLKPHGSGFAGRMACEAEFQRNTYLSCVAMHGNNPVGLANCVNVANGYVGIVALLGGAAFTRATPPTPNVSVGPLEPIRDEEGDGQRGGGGGGGGGFGRVIGGGGSFPTGTVKVGEPEKVDETSAK